MIQDNGVPFVDLITPHLELESELIDAVRNVIRSAAFVGGAAVEHFENEYAAFCGVDHCVGVGSGTDALRFALIAVGVEAHDIVITVPNTFVATVEAILQAKATPHFVDVHPETSNMDVERLGEYLHTQCDRGKNGETVHRSSGARVRAVLPVHLYGQMCDMDPIMKLADEFDLLVVEDACQAHGGEYFSEAAGEWCRAGSIGHAGAFSFYPGKNLGACGEAGAVTTNDNAVAQHIRMLRDHGQRAKYHHAIEGYNGRLDTIQAALLRVKLPHLDKWNEQRRAAARLYDALLNTVDPIAAPIEPLWSRSAYHLYVVRLPRRDEMADRLLRNGIATGLHYPIPIHLQTGYEYLGYRSGVFPAAELLAREILSLPMYPQIAPDDQTRVVGMLSRN